jgi:hypothetical protein
VILAREEALREGPTVEMLARRTPTLNVRVGFSALCPRANPPSDVEKTMIELEHQTVVWDTRSAFQAAIQHKFSSEVQRLSGRRVLAFISNHHVGPDLEIELFVLSPAPDA